MSPAPAQPQTERVDLPAPDNPAQTDSLGQPALTSTSATPLTKTEASATPITLPRAPLEHCPIWKVYRGVDDQDEDEEARVLAQKKQKSENKKLNRKRKKDAIAANTEYVAGTPGQRNTFCKADVKYAFLQSAWEEFQPIVNGSYQAVRIPLLISACQLPANVQPLKIANKFVNRFGRNLPLRQDPDPGINYEPHSVNLYPEHERIAEQARRVEFDKGLRLVIMSR